MRVKIRNHLMCVLANYEGDNEDNVMPVTNITTAFFIAKLAFLSKANIVVFCLTGMLSLFGLRKENTTIFCCNVMFAFLLFLHNVVQLLISFVVPLYCRFSHEPNIFIFCRCTQKTVTIFFINQIILLSSVVP